MSLFTWCALQNRVPRVKEVKEIGPLRLVGPDAAGSKVLRWLLEADPETIGWVPSTVTVTLSWGDTEELEISQVAGSGGSSVVYVSKLGGEEVAVKVAKTPEDARGFKREKDIHVALDKQLGDNFTKLVGWREVPATSADEKDALEDGDGKAFDALVLQPVGERFTDQSEPTLAELCELVDAIAELHERGYVHRDVKRSNFFRKREVSDVWGVRFLTSDLLGVAGPGHSSQ